MGSAVISGVNQPAGRFPPASELFEPVVAHAQVEGEPIDGPGVLRVEAAVAVHLPFVFQIPVAHDQHGTGSPEDCPGLVDVPVVLPLAVLHVVLDAEAGLEVVRPGHVGDRRLHVAAVVLAAEVLQDAGARSEPGCEILERDPRDAVLLGIGEREVGALVRSGRLEQQPARRGPGPVGGAQVRRVGVAAEEGLRGHAAEAGPHHPVEVVLVHREVGGQLVGPVHLPGDAPFWTLLSPWLNVRNSSCEQTSGVAQASRMSSGVDGSFGSKNESSR